MPAINQYPQLKADAGAANGGTGQTSYAVGDMLYASGITALSKLGIGSANTVLTSSGTAPQWSTSLTLAGNLQANGNTTLGDSSTDTVTVNGYMGVGGAGTANTSVYVTPTALTGTSQYGIYSTPRVSSAGTSQAAGLTAFVRTEAAAFTLTNLYGVSIENANKGAGSTITSQHGLYVADQTQGTNNFGVTSVVSSGANKWNIYASGTATNYFAGNVQFAAGSATSPALTRFGDDNTGLFFPAADTIAFAEGGVESMRLDSAGNLGLGTTNPTPGDVTGAPALTLRGTNARINIGTAASDMANGDIATLSFIAEDPRAVSSVVRNLAMIKAIYAGSNTTLDTNLTFSTAAASSTASERMRITPTGEVYIAGTTDQGAYNLQVNGTGVWGAGAYVNGSDERLKDNITSLESCLDVVASLRPVTFQYKPEHSLDQSVQPGFIAQELQQAMAGKSYLDGVVQTGPEYLNVAYQNLIPILTKAIQEQQALIETLTARVAVLEAN
jgi:hypothetical protein